MALIEINKKAQINVIKDNQIHPILCDVKGVTLDKVYLFCPLEYREMASNLREGMQIELNVYSFSGIIVLSSTVRKLQPDQILIDYPVEKERVQRREYFRVSIQRPIEIYYNDGYKDRAYKGNTIDISGGGVRFWTKENLQVGFIANMVLHLTGFFTPYEPISANGRILYTKNHDSRLTSKAGYISVIKFHEISQKHRQLIMKTCFKLQIEMRKKGVL